MWLGIGFHSWCQQIINYSALHINLPGGAAMHLADITPTVTEASLEVLMNKPTCKLIEIIIVTLPAMYM